MTEKNVNDLTEKFKKLSLQSFETVFEINLKTATKTTKNSKCLEAKSATNTSYILSQNDPLHQPTFGSNYVENKASNFMIFLCPELQFANVSIFVVSNVHDTFASSEGWKYIIGNDDGAYDKFTGYKALSYSKLVHGGLRNGDKTTVVLPVRFSIQHNKNLISCHWLQYGSCMYGNGSLLTGSEFKADLKHIGSPIGSIFLANKTSSSKLHGKIFGFKIIQGFMTGPDIIKIHQEMIKEYDVDV